MVGREGRGAGLRPPLLTWPHPAYSMVLQGTLKLSLTPGSTGEFQGIETRAEHGREGEDDPWMTNPTCVRLPCVTTLDS